MSLSAPFLFGHLPPSIVSESVYSFVTSPTPEETHVFQTAYLLPIFTSM